jgi:hypothetical protein
MAKRYPGGRIGAVYPITTSGKTGIASGIWSVTEAAQKINAASWPTPLTVSGAPTIGAVTVTSSTSVTVAFTAPIDNGGTAITSYTAVSSPGGITGSLSQAGSGTISVSGLTGGTAYTFTVYATNSVGNSSSSASSNSITMNLAATTSVE